MPNLKLARLPDRTPVKLTLSLSPDLYRMLGAYASLYAEAYGQEAKVEDLAPEMLVGFLQSDRGFLKAQEQSRRDNVSDVR